MKLKLLNTVRNQYYAFKYGSRGDKQTVRWSRKDALRHWPLTQPYSGRIKLEHRVVCGPVTRCRSVYPTGELSDMNVEWYRQRATRGALMVTEAVTVALNGRVTRRAPGIWSDQQEESFKALAEVGKEAGCTIVPQLYHCGRQAYAVQEHEVAGLNVPHKDRDYTKVLSPSGVKIPQTPPEGYSTANFALGVPQDHVVEMTPRMITQAVDDFRTAAVRLKRAGFTGVNVAMSGGGLIHNFCHHKTNRRTDSYGGDAWKRTKFAVDVMDAVSEVFPAKHVGVTIHVGYTSCGLSDTAEHELSMYKILINEIEERKVGHLLYWDQCKIPSSPADPGFLSFYEAAPALLKHVRDHYTGCLVSMGNGDRFAQAAEDVAEVTCSITLSEKILHV
eukprot:TRINITY_DN4015_c0_g2_i2.p1 TRINITY_DN4015_c0_g2~~TRINITY_DN4015_c0_g2_i2.p1  ORF type:complete len:429 (+),score=108.79 TRINITY_DN4015_c0_g2_i2:122-1288(+)